MIGSLFSGIGGLELGLEWAGLGPVRWQVEIDPFCRRVLAKHWPDAERHEDVTRISRMPHVDVICGGFPCQDVSSAGKRAGLKGSRSSLWFHFQRIVSVNRPRVVIVENVASGKAKWLPTVRRGLCSLGYRTRALALSAADVGAPHLRRRIFVVAHADRHRKPPRAIDAEVGGASEAVADVERDDVRQQQGWGRGSRGSSATEPRLVGWRDPQPAMVRVVYGFPRGVDGRRRRALGNAVVPQCAEVIGRIVLEMTS